MAAMTKIFGFGQMAMFANIKGGCSLIYFLFSLSFSVRVSAALFLWLNNVVLGTGISEGLLYKGSRGTTPMAAGTTLWLCRPLSVGMLGTAWKSCGVCVGYTAGFGRSDRAGGRGFEDAMGAGSGRA